MCSLCRGVGWILECNPTRNPLNVEFLPCPIPDCELSGRAIEIISVDYLHFTKATHHPKTNELMSIRK